jgi:hypothetical protein
VELAARATARVPGHRVLLSSGFPGAANLDTGGQPGTSFLQKPFSIDRLFQLVRGLLDAPPPAGRAPVGEPAGTRTTP